MSLQEKVIRLKLDALMAAKHAAFWQKAITEHGEEKATAFYTSLGLNHLEKKSIQWEGLTLSREPKEHEKLAVKGVSQAQESAKESLIRLLLELRTELISDGLKSIQDLTPATYHQLVLDTPAEFRPRLRDRLIEVFHDGRDLVSRELTGRPKGKHHPCDTELKFRELGIVIKQDDVGEFEELDDLTDLTDARVINDVQSRITSAAARFALLGLTGAALYEAISKEVNAGSTGYIDRAAAGAANTVLNFGRAREARLRRDQWGTVEYSALLDQNVCGPCAAEDGTTANNEDDLQPAPNPECEGSDWCRCFHVYINQ